MSSNDIFLNIFFNFVDILNINFFYLLYYQTLNIFYYFIYLLLISLAYGLGLFETLFNYLFIIIEHYVFTCKFKLIMNI